MAENIQAAESRHKKARRRIAWTGGWLAVLALALWLTHLSAVLLLIAVLGACAWTAVGPASRSRSALAATVALWATIGITGGVQYRLAEVAGDWARLQGRIEERAAAELGRQLEALVDRGEEAVAGVAAVLPEAGTSAPAAPVFERLEEVRRRSGVAALAVFGAQGGPLAWSGEHRGTIPVGARLGVEPYVHHEGPLFSYVYFTRRLAGDRTAVAAVLLESRLEVDEPTQPFAGRFERRFGLRPRFYAPARARGEAVWDWSTDRPILSVSFVALTQQHWWERVVARGRSGVGLGLAAAVLLISLLWYRRRVGAPGVPVAVATAAAVLAPLGEMAGREKLFSPLYFLLPGPADVTLGVLLALLLGVGIWMLTRAGEADPKLTVPLPLQGIVAAISAPLVILLVERSAAHGLLAESLAGGLTLQLTTTLLLAIPLFLLLYASARRGGSRGLGTALFAGGLALALGLGITVMLLWRPGRELLPWTAALWAPAFVLVSASATRLFPSRSGLRSWVIAGLFAGTIALPHLWVMHTAAELENAEGELAELGTGADPFLDFLLRQFADQAQRLAERGEDGVNLLYRSWVESRLAEHGHQPDLVIWSGGRPETELTLSRSDTVPDVVRQMAARVEPGDGALVRLFTESESLHYLLVAPLPDGRVVTVAVPPRTQIGARPALARFLYPGARADAAAQNETLYLVPAGPEERVDTLDRTVQWIRTESAWRSEAWARFPSGWMHAHLFVRTPAIPVVLIRGLLALAAIVGVMFALWAVARLLCGELRAFPLVRQGWVRSFRGRLTIALFLFFLVPTIIFGAVAYSAVAREVVFSAAAQAHRTLEDAAPLARQDRLPEVGREVRSDLLLYRRGFLIGSAAPEVIDLGLFHAWLPPRVYLDFASGEDTEAQENRRLAGNDYLVAYHRLDAESVLAAPIPLASEEITRRQREFRDIALLVSLLGAAFSIFLSLLVARALSRPIAELSQAATTVGGGNLRVRLPERRPDEFGTVYRSFNRMVQRLRRARAALAREARRTETIVAEAATGVLALDADGRVELANPRAAQILGVEPRRGEPLASRGPLLRAVTGALREFRRSGVLESGREIEVEGRIVRLRFRRLTGGDGPGGSVVALEDVTSEVRSARVLAWGEMARQVAHEIKNPLTPIKLSVQHLRRAFADERPDFGDILDRNVEAILQEIDRLGEIARAFARFGTPTQGEDLEAVDLGRVIPETLVLYRGGGTDGASFHARLAPGEELRVVARTGELKEVLVNLLENAREAIDGGGDITVAAGPSGDPGWVEVVVSDTGEGIESELLPRIFEPHFSTRTSGTGLGLAIVRRLVESWGGSIEAESEPGAGTRMRLRLRAAPDGGDEGAQGTALAPPSGRLEGLEHAVEETMTDLKRGEQRGGGATEGVQKPTGADQEKNEGAEFGTSERGTRGTDRDLDRSGESSNQGHGHPREERDGG